MSGHTVNIPPPHCCSRPLSPASPLCTRGASGLLSLQGAYHSPPELRGYGPVSPSLPRSTFSESDLGKTRLHCSDFPLLKKTYGSHLLCISY